MIGSCFRLELTFCKKSCILSVALVWMRFVPWSGDCTLTICMQNNYGNWLYNFELFSVIVFSFEYIARVWSAPAKREIDLTNSPLKARVRYIFSFYGLIDLVAILPFYIQAFFPGLDLRVLRALRLLRILKLNHYNSALDDLFGAIVEEKKSFMTTLYIFSVAFVFILPGVVFSLFFLLRTCQVCVFFFHAFGCSFFLRANFFFFFS